MSDIHHNHSKYLFGLLGLGIFTISLSLYRANLLPPKKATIPDEPPAIGDSTPSPTLIPFVELTIPYLRTKTYQSTLDQLTLHEDKPLYKSFLTNYQSDNFKIKGLLTLPKGDAPPGGWPAVIFIHGYIPPDQYKTTQKYVDYVDYLARNNLAVFKIDLRGHGESEGEASGAYYSSDYIIDVLNAKKALQTTEQINSSAIGLWGHSMGGNIVLRSMAVDPSLKVGVIWAGAVYSYEDFTQFRISDGSYRPPAQVSTRQRQRDLLFAAHGTFDPLSSFWQQVPATNYFSDLAGSRLQLHHSVDDDVVSVEYSRNLSKLAKSSSFTVELYEYSSGGHNLNGSSFSTAMSRTVDFYHANF